MIQSGTCNATCTVPSGSTLYVGSTSTFTGINFVMSTPMSGPAGGSHYEYWSTNPATWSQLCNNATCSNGTLVGGAQFAQNGVYSFTLPTATSNNGLWAQTAVNGTTLYWLRFRFANQTAGPVFSGITPSQPPLPPGVNLTLSAQTITLNAGQTAAQLTANLAAVSGFTGSLTLTLLESDGSGLPVGISATYNPPGAITVPGSGTITINTTSAVTPGTYVLTVFADTAVGVTPGVHVTSPVVLVVQPAGAPPDFTISATPATATLSPSVPATFTVDAEPTTGSTSSTVALSVTGVPTGATASFNPTSIVTGTTSVLTVTDTSAAAGSYTLTITGASTTTTHTAAVTVTIGTPSYTLTVTPTTATVVVGTPTSFTIAVVPSGGFNGTVALSIGTLSATVGGTAVFNPTSITPGTTSTLTITPANAYPNAYFTVTGTSGSLTANIHGTITATAVPPKNTIINGAKVSGARVNQQ